MTRYPIIALLTVLLAVPAWPQEEPAGSEEDATTTAEEAQDEAEQTAAADVVDDSDLDEQTYEEGEDDFVPTEEIPADEPIPFPSNI